MQRTISPLFSAGWAFVSTGLLLALFFFLFYDTTVGEIHDVGLLQNQLCGVILGVGLSVLGGLLLLLQAVTEAAGHNHRAVVLLTVLANKQGCTQEDIQRALGG